ncbi:response regulator [Candidatus Poribacteria bacterium]|nr:response regulator [Candidatus Poribacteria bacterium]
MSNKNDLAEANTESLRILVIDDQQTIRDLFYEILSRDGHEVTLSHSSSKGLRDFDEQPYDIVYTDLSMPGKTGLEVASEIKKKSPNTIVILITGWALEDEMSDKQIKEKGVDIIVAKPFRIHHVKESVRQAIRIRQNIPSKSD